MIRIFNFPITSNLGGMYLIVIICTCYVMYDTFDVRVVNLPCLRTREGLLCTVVPRGEYPSIIIMHSSYFLETKYNFNALGR